MQRKAERSSSTCCHLWRRGWLTAPFCWNSAAPFVFTSSTNRANAVTDTIFASSAFKISSSTRICAQSAPHADVQWTESNPTATSFSKTCSPSSTCIVEYVFFRFLLFSSFRFTQISRLALANAPLEGMRRVANEIALQALPFLSSLFLPAQPSLTCVPIFSPSPQPNGSIISFKCRKMPLKSTKKDATCI